MRRIALGTAQFGLHYGIANRLGQVERQEAGLILEHARAMRIDTLDTAIAYGESEQALGAIGVQHWRIVTKLPAVPESCSDVPAWVRESVRGALQRLGVHKLYGLLLHRSAQLLGPQGEALYRALLAIKEEGGAERIGISIYDPDELEMTAAKYRVDLVQAPVNVLDRRLVSSGWLSRLHQAGVEVHARSIFLQGLLLMERASRPASFDRWRSVWDQWHRWLDETQVTPVQACLRFALSLPEIDRVIVGVDSLSQLREILAAVDLQNAADVPPALTSEDVNLINPSRWAAT